MNASLEYSITHICPQFIEVLQNGTGAGADVEAEAGHLSTFKLVYKNSSTIRIKKMD